MANPVSSLEGWDYSYFEMLATTLPDADKGRFLESVNYALDADMNGAFDLVDKGAEAARVALLIHLNPEINFNSITLLDIGSYKDNIFAKELEAYNKKIRPQIESQVESIFNQIERNPKDTEVVFNGVKYLIGADDLSSAVNNELERYGSKKRAIFAVDDERRPNIVYGEINFEKKIKIAGRDVRLMYMKNAKEIRKDGSYLALNDGVSSIVVIESRIKSVLESRFEKTNFRSHYKYSTNKAVFKHFQEQLGGVSKENLKLLGEVVLNHERGHFEMRAEHGNEYRFLEMALLKINDPTLKILDEIYAELTGLRHIIYLRTKGEKVAEKALMGWIVLRGERIRNSALDLFEESIYNVLISSVDVKEDQRVVVDWSKMQYLFVSLNQELKSIFEEIKFNICIDVPGIGGSPDTPKKIALQNCAKVKKIAMDHLEKENPGKPKIMYRLETALGMVSAAVERKDPIGRPMIDSFRGDMLKYQRRIDDWMRKNVGLRDRSVPFKAPIVKEISVEDLQKMLP